MKKNKKKSYAPKRLLSYVVASDNGLAPNVTGGVCTLSVCKPVVRKVARAGADYIIGMSTAPDDRNRVIYVMQVDEKIPFADYFNDKRFQAKKPGNDIKGDNFFRAEKGQLKIAFDNASHTGKAQAIARDLKAPVAVVGHRFWYFGENAPELPEELRQTKIPLPDAYRRGHRVTDDAATIRAFTKWLDQFEPGIHGKPRDPVKTAKKKPARKPA